MKTSEHFESDLLFFFAEKPEALSLCQLLLQRLEKAFPEAAARVQKSQVSFYGRHLFAMVSLPRRKRDPGLVVSFGLGRRLDAPRVAVAVEPYPNRWTHHIPVACEADLDEELMGWLQEAWTFSETKK